METPLLINDFLRRAAKLYADKTAIVDGPLRLRTANTKSVLTRWRMHCCDLASPKATESVF